MLLADWLRFCLKDSVDLTFSLAIGDAVLKVEKVAISLLE